MFKDGPIGCLGLAHESGWMTGENFYKSLVHFQSFVKSSKEKPVLLILDNHSSHLDYRAVTFAKDNGIVLPVRIYTNTLLLSARWRHHTVTEFSVPTCPKPPSLSLSLSAARRRGSLLFVSPVFSLWELRVSPSLVKSIFIPTFPNYTSVECLNSSFCNKVKFFSCNVFLYCAKCVISRFHVLHTHTWDLRSHANTNASCMMSFLFLDFQHC